MGSELDNARHALTHIRNPIAECRAGLDLFDVGDGMIYTLEDEPGTALHGLNKLEAFAVTVVVSCEAQAVENNPLTEGADDGKQRSGDGQD